MKFVKMHGAGNDYVFVDCFQMPPPDKPHELARAVSDRHTGVGADGLILIATSEHADARMRMFNADGSEAEMCGNGVRCIAKYLYDHGLARRDRLTLETGRGILTLDVLTAAGRVERVRVNMGQPILEPAKIPVQVANDPTVPMQTGADPEHLVLSQRHGTDDVVERGRGQPPRSSADAPAMNVPLQVGGHRLRVTCVSMGNPHCVTFVDELSDHLVGTLGPQLERHEAFPNHTNAEFVRVLGRSEISVRVWERGSGETRACGTGACAAVVAGVLNELVESGCTAHLPGGDLQIEWADSGDVFLTGPAVEVFTGEWPM